MNNNFWRNYWIGITLVLLIIQTFHVYNYITQPDLGDYYTGKTVIYSVFVFGLAGMVFIGINTYAFIICLKERKLYKWIKSFIACLVFLYLSLMLLSKVSEKFMPLDVWGKSTLQKLQQNNN